MIHIEDYACQTLDELNEDLLSRAMGIEKERITFHGYNKYYSPLEICNNYIIETDFEALRQEFDEDKNIPFFHKESRTWRVKLSKNPDNTFYEKYINGVQIKKFELEVGEPLVKGHYIAEGFDKFLLPKECYGRAFFNKMPSNNTYYQSRISNGNVINKISGQLCYEQLIYNYFMRNDEDIYYEIQDVRDPEKKEKSLGRRILILFPNKGYHVFIPNVCRI